jgi:hypothetical protein
VAPDRSEPTLNAYQVTSLYRRTVAAIPRYKRLIRVRSLDDWPQPAGTRLGQLCPDVVFRTLVDAQGRRYWARQWLHGRDALEAATERIERFLAGLGRSDLVLSVDRTTKFGLIYPYDASLFASTEVVHQWDVRWYFSADEIEAIRRLAGVVVRAPELPEIALGSLTDFQVVRAGERILFIDFEPSSECARRLAIAVGG